MAKVAAVSCMHNCIPTICGGNVKTGKGCRFDFSKKTMTPHGGRNHADQLFADGSKDAAPENMYQSAKSERVLPALLACKSRRHSFTRCAMRLNMQQRKVGTVNFLMRSFSTSVRDSSVQCLLTRRLY